MKKNFLLVFLSLVLCSNLNSQDLIYKKDKTIQKAQVIEVGTNIIKFKKYEIPNGPIFETLIIDIVKVKYYNGYEDIYDTTYADSNFISINPKSFLDTANYSMIYMVYNHGHNESNLFPCYFNDQYVWTIKGNRRLAYKIFSEGQLTIERGNKTTGPSLNLTIHNGKSYYIYIEMANQYALDFNKRFALRLVTEEMEKEKYSAYFNFRLSAFKDDTKNFTEDLKNPVIKNKNKRK